MNRSSRILVITRLPKSMATLQQMPYDELSRLIASAQGGHMAVDERNRRLLSGDATWVALQRAVHELQSTAPNDCDVLLLVDDLAVTEAQFQEPHTFLFRGVTREGHQAWAAMHFTQVAVAARGAITIEPTAYRELKTEESAAEVEIDAVFAEELRKFKPVGEPTFVINSNLRPRPGIDREYYRAEPVFQRLYTWLRAKGIKTRSPLHTLRKEFGSAISSYYTDNKRRIALPMADYLHGRPQALGKPSSKENPAG